MMSLLEKLRQNRRPFGWSHYRLISISAMFGKAGCPGWSHYRLISISAMFGKAGCPGWSHYRLISGITGIILVSCVGGFFIYQHSGKKSALPEHIQKSQEMEKANTRFEVYDLSRQTITLASLQNKVVVINFWATWCAPCVEDMPSLN